MVRTNQRQRGTKEQAEPQNATGGKEACGVSTLFVTTTSTETLNGIMFGVIGFIGGETKVLHPKSYRLAAKIPHYEISLHGQSRNPC